METFNGERARAKRGDARTVEGREPREEKGEEGTGKGTLSHGRRRVRKQQKHQVESHAVSATFSYYADVANFIMTTFETELKECDSTLI